MAQCLDDQLRLGDFCAIDIQLTAGAFTVGADAVAGTGCRYFCNSFGGADMAHSGTDCHAAGSACHRSALLRGEHHIAGGNGQHAFRTLVNGAGEGGQRQIHAHITGAVAAHGKALLLLLQEEAGGKHGFIHYITFHQGQTLRDVQTIFITPNAAGHIGCVGQNHRVCNHIAGNHLSFIHRKHDRGTFHDSAGAIGAVHRGAAGNAHHFIAILIGKEDIGGSDCQLTLCARIDRAGNGGQNQIATHITGVDPAHGSADSGVLVEGCEGEFATHSSTVHQSQAHRNVQKILIIPNTAVNACRIDQSKGIGDSIAGDYLRLVRGDPNAGVRSLFFHSGCCHSHGQQHCHHQQQTHESFHAFLPPCIFTLVCTFVCYIKGLCLCILSLFPIDCNGLLLILYNSSYLDPKTAYRDHRTKRGQPAGRPTYLLYHNRRTFVHRQFT